MPEMHQDSSESKAKVVAGFEESMAGGNEWRPYGGMAGGNVCRPYGGTAGGNECRPYGGSASGNE